MNLFEDYFLNVIKQHYVDFAGRASRSQFWYFTLFSFLISLAISVVTGIIGSVLNTGIFSLLGVLYSLAIMVPSVCLGIRRLHDTGKSGWWYLISLVPFVGFIILIVFWVMDSEADRNQYGPNPKRGAVA